MPDVHEDEVVINVALFKALGIFALCDPNSPKAFGCNAYRLACIVIIVTVHCINAYGLLGFVAPGAGLASGSMDDITLFPIIFTFVNVSMCSFKLLTVVHNANVIWELLDVTRTGFLSSARCARHAALLRGYRATSIAVTNYLVRFAGLILIVWVATPFATNTFAPSSSADPSRRYDNVYNIPYPVSLDVYNRYYFAFYVLELALALFLFFATVTLITITFSFSLAVIAQYEIVFLAVAEVEHGYDGNDNNVNQYKENFISILKDHQRLFVKLQTLYSTLYLIIFLSTLATSTSIIVVACSLAKMLLHRSSQTLSFMMIFKVSLPAIYLCINLFYYCYLLDKINTKKESVEFGMYSCNWTEISLSFRKLLLLSMRMSNSNKLMIKATPKKVINLMFFANIMMTTYNIASVLVKTRV